MVIIYIMPKRRSLRIAKKNKNNVVDINDHLGQVAIDKFNEMMGLMDYSAFYIEYIDSLKVGIRIENKFTNSLIDLFEMGYVFSNRFLLRLFGMITRYEYDYNRNDHSYIYKSYLFSTNPTHVRFMKIFFSKVVLLNRNIVRNKSAKYINKFIEYGYKFTQYQIKMLTNNCDGEIKYLDNGVLNESLIIYINILLSQNKKIDDNLFNSWINMVKESKELSFYYFEACYNNFGIKNNVNKDNCEILLTALFYNLLNNGNNNDLLINFITKNTKRYSYIDKLVFTHLYNDTLIDKFNNANMFGNGLEYLLHIVEKYNYVVNVEFLNKILLKTQYCDIHITNGEYGYIKQYVKIAKCKNNIGNVIINFGGDTFIEVNNGNYEGKVNVIDLFTVFNIVPDVNTLNISLKKGYVNVVDKLVNNWGIIVGDESLKESVRGKHLDMIEYVLKSGVVIGKDIVTLLFDGKEKNNIVHKRDGYDVRRKKRAFKWRISKIKQNKSLTLAQQNEKINSLKNSAPKDIIMDIMELLINYGLVVDLNIVGLLLSYNKCLERLDRFGILYDEDLYFVCYVNEYYPEEYMKKLNIDKNVLELRKLLKSNVSETKVIEYLKTHNIKLDGYTFEYGLLNNNKYIDTLMNKNYYIPKDNIMYKYSFCVWNNYYYAYSYNVDKYCEYIRDNNVTKDSMVALVNV